MICIKTEIPKEICEIDDELKAIYHSKDTICIWVFKTRVDRNKFMDETAGMLKDDREKHYLEFYFKWTSRSLFRTFLGDYFVLDCNLQTPIFCLFISRKFFVI